MAKWLPVMVIGVIIFGVWLHSFLVSRKLRAHAAPLNDREDIPPEGTWQKYYEREGIPREFVLDFLNAFASAYELQPEKIRPSDRLDRELKIPKGCERDVRQEFTLHFERLVKECGVKVADLGALESETVDTSIRSTWRAIQKARTSSEFEGSKS